MKIFIDSSIFLGMHAADDAIRISTKNFFVEHFDDTMYMTLEEVGECDDVIWKYGRKEQDAYYPFMDRLHTVMRIERIPCNFESLQRLKIDETLSTKENLLLCMVEMNEGQLFTLRKNLHAAHNTYVHTVPIATQELKFDDDLEQYYESSLALRINTNKEIALLS